MSKVSSVVELGPAPTEVADSPRSLTNAGPTSHDDQKGSPTTGEVAIELQEWETLEAKPFNWSLGRKSWHVIMVGLMCWLVTFGTSVYTPGAVEIAREFSASRQAVTLGLSLYSLGLGAGPCIGAPLSETFGRWVVFVVSVPAAALFTLGAGFSKSLGSLLVCRFFAGLMGGPPLSIGGGVLADLFPAQKRAIAGSIFIAAPFLGPCTGPIIGGFVAQYEGWRWTQWVALLAVLPIIAGIFTMRETYHKLLVRRREEALGLLPSIPSPKLRVLLTVVLVRPLHMIFFEPIVACLGIYTSFIFGVLYIFFAAFPIIFQGIYGFTISQLGLSFTGTGVGVLIAVGTNILIDRMIYQKQVRRSWERGDRGVVAPEHRLYSAMFGSFTIPIALFWFGWSARGDMHWISPIIATVPFAWGNLSIFHAAALYSTDVYGAVNGASALAANGMMRYIISAAFPLFAVQLYNSLGIGWASSLLGLVSVAFVPLPFILFRWGPKIRQNSHYETIKA
ncbi:hypothetical protein M409DRAFT_54685 [Zasmidium cellare ATCC 36951]|uniref:Cercosporin MFS transporter CTB4 n=1 Tax=Zasmidium cellare ATCC 36951 TaxID=1080233 RepID=A0A6A6CIR0_ZASCE|nr:uncharacterized protein M409DRAFT_54685 [Zasmidium cellare ATCC 36951]KAF2166921.1 hypothetical protein M409DRAFT_54685 [Zasmidium cellare ATCC 36951]